MLYFRCLDIHQRNFSMLRFMLVLSTLCQFYLLLLILLFYIEVHLILFWVSWWWAILVEIFNLFNILCIWCPWFWYGTYNSVWVVMLINWVRMRIRWLRLWIWIHWNIHMTTSPLLWRLKLWKSFYTRSVNGILTFMLLSFFARNLFTFNL